MGGVTGHYSIFNTSLAIMILDKDQTPNTSEMKNKRWNYVFAYSLGDAMDWVKNTYKYLPGPQTTVIRHHGSGNLSSRRHSPHDTHPNGGFVRIGSTEISDFLAGNKMNTSVKRSVQNYYDLGSILPSGANVIVSSCNCAQDDSLVDETYNVLSHNGTNNIRLFMNLGQSITLVRSKADDEAQKNPMPVFLKTGKQLSADKTLYNGGWVTKSGNNFLDKVFNTFRFGIKLKSKGGFKTVPKE